MHISHNHEKQSIHYTEKPRNTTSGVSEILSKTYTKPINPLPAEQEARLPSNALPSATAPHKATTHQNSMRLSEPMT